jgi:hypothetical protein
MIMITMMTLTTALLPTTDLTNTGIQNLVSITIADASSGGITLHHHSLIADQSATVKMVPVDDNPFKPVIDWTNGGDFSVDLADLNGGELCG